MKQKLDAAAFYILGAMMLIAFLGGLLLYLSE